MTAYELRISDWSSDVCSSDLAADRLLQGDDLLLQGTGDLLGDRGGAFDGLLHQLAMAARQFLGAVVLKLDRRSDAGDLGRLVLEDAARGFDLADDHVDRKSTRLNSSH